jgi:hypothetical protein
MAAKKQATPKATPKASPLTTPYPTTSVADLNKANVAARKATEAWASPFSTAFGGTAPSTTLDYVRQYASPSSDIFGGTQSSALPYSPSAMVNPVTGQPAAPMAGYQFPIVTPKPAGKDLTNQIYILIAKLKAVGIPESLANRAGAFFTALQDDGIDDEDNMIDIFLNTKSYKSKKTGQEIISPYYTDFGKFNDGLSSAKPPSILVPWVLGLRDTVKKYDTDGSLSLYSTDESIQKYLKNSVKVSDLDSNLNQARLRGITADPVYVDTLTKMGFIKTAADLTGFFASPELGQQQLELNRNSAAFGVEALRRAKEGGVQLDTEFAKKQAAALTAQGYNEAGVSSVAEKGYQAIARNIMPTVKLSGVYQGAQAANAATVQSGLQQQEFMGVDYETATVVGGQEIGAFQGSAGNIRSPRISSYRDDITGQI